MAEDKKKKKGPKSPKWSSAFIWAATQWAIAWFIIDVGSVWDAATATFGGFIAGWSTAGLLGKFARWGAGVYAMMILGVVVGAAFSSGAIAGLDFLYTWIRSGSVEMDWEELTGFILSGAIVPAVALGLFTGVYVRSVIPAKGK